MPVEALTVREAGYVAGLPYAAINRMIDNRRVPASVLVRKNRERMLTVPGVVCVAIEKEAGSAFTAVLRKKLRDCLRRDVKRLEPTGAGWCKELSVELNGMRGVVKLDAIWARIAGRLRRIERLREIVVEDDEIQAGAPTFAGTRILVRPIAEALKEGDTPHELRKHYPRLTEEMIELARLYVATKPARGRPKSKVSASRPKSARMVRRRA